VIFSQAIAFPSLRFRLEIKPVVFISKWFSIVLSQGFRALIRTRPLTTHYLKCQVSRGAEPLLRLEGNWCRSCLTVHHYKESAAGRLAISADPIIQKSFWFRPSPANWQRFKITSDFKSPNCIFAVYFHHQYHSLILEMDSFALLGSLSLKGWLFLQRIHEKNQYHLHVVTFVCLSHPASWSHSHYWVSVTF